MLIFPLSAEKSGAYPSPDSPGAIPESSNSRYYASLLWEARHQGVSANGFVAGKKPCGRTRAHLYRGTDLKTAPPFSRSDIGHIFQVERGLLMHSTGFYIKDERAFSEKFWGHRTAIYVKLAKEISDSRWESFYMALAHTEEVHEKMSEFSKPVEHWTDNPDEYYIVGSDPVDAE